MIHKLINGPEDEKRFLYGDGEIEAQATEAQLLYIKDVEAALGIKLFRWQKYMLIGAPEYGRRSGKTLAWCLWRLVQLAPVDMTPDARRHWIRKEKFAYDMMAEIVEKLDAAGVPHAPVCRTAAELREARSAMIRLARSSGKHPNPGWYIVDDFKGEYE